MDNAQDISPENMDITGPPVTTWGGDGTIVEKNGDDREPQLPMDIPAELKAEVDQLPLVASQKLEDLRNIKDAVADLIESVSHDNKELTERCHKLENQITLFTHKLRKGDSIQVQLEKELTVCRKTLEERKTDMDRLEAEGFYLGVDMLHTMAEQFSKISQKHMEIKSSQCISNGTQTLIYRSGELRRQLESVIAERDALKAQYPHVTVPAPEEHGGNTD